MDFEAEAENYAGRHLTSQYGDVSIIAVEEFADALRRAYEAGAADALVKGIDLAAGDDWAPVTQGGE